MEDLCLFLALEILNVYNIYKKKSSLESGYLQRLLVNEKTLYVCSY